MKEEYNQEPVYYCPKCLSLRIRFIKTLSGMEYCDDCGGTNIQTSSIEEWEQKFIERFKHPYIEIKNK